MTSPLALRAEAEGLASPLPALLAEAEHLAGAVLLGDHGRRRAGMGDTFWQYRPAQDHDEVRRIDWRRSARSDATFVQDKEWQIAQSVVFWVDQAASMRFASEGAMASKSARARLLALALSILLNRGGERIGLTGNRLPPQRGAAQLEKLAALLSEDATSDYGSPDTQGLLPHARAVFLSDFLGDISGAEAALTKSADRGIRGLVIQVLDPQEEAFPFNGRTIFQSMGGGLEHETLQAGDLRDRYLDRLAARKAYLMDLARTTGWQYLCHHTDTPATRALLWAYQALERPA